MKRKRGKKGQSKKPPKVGMTEADSNFLNLSTEDISGPDEMEKDEANSQMDTETPSSTGIDQPEKPVAVGSTGIIDKPVGRLVYNRVKVKIKPSKALEHQRTSSEAHTPSDTDKSSQHMSLDKQVVSDKVEDSANSVPESNVGVATTQAKKAGSIKIKSSKGFGSNLSPCTSTGTVQPQTERTHQKEHESLCRESVYNKQELNTSLEVIKKIMKMDAAEPFNAPVNPIALGIPDYFDVIKTPMDFGTICSNLESGLKYMNSGDVYKDVQYIWDNCYKYNSKGDYILELMKRVKKNFSKYWTAAGLYTEQQQVNSGDMKDNNSGHGKPPGKAGYLKHKSRKRHGVKRHKDDCLCAICVMMRRRQEREQVSAPADDQTETSEGPVREVKTEVTSPVESPNGDDSSFSTDNSQNQDTEAEMEDKGEEVKLEDAKELQSDLPSKQEVEKEKDPSPQTNGEDTTAEQFHLDSRPETEKHEDTPTVEAVDHKKNDTSNQDKSTRRENEATAVELQKPKELLGTSEKTKLYENLRQCYENPMPLKLCGSLFPENPKSLWSGPHSLVNRRGSSRSSSIGAAVATFMK